MRTQVDYILLSLAEDLKDIVEHGEKWNLFKEVNDKDDKYIMEALKNTINVNINHWIREKSCH